VNFLRGGHRKCPKINFYFYFHFVVFLRGGLEKQVIIKVWPKHYATHLQRLYWPLPLPSAGSYTGRMTSVSALDATSTRSTLEVLDPGVSSGLQSQKSPPCSDCLHNVTWASLTPIPRGNEDWFIDGYGMYSVPNLGFKKSLSRLFLRLGIVLQFRVNCQKTVTLLHCVGYSFSCFTFHYNTSTIYWHILHPCI
jgi:hypothetical protein